jgi:hypothetical protein
MIQFNLRREFMQEFPTDFQSVRQKFFTTESAEKGIAHSVTKEEKNWFCSSWASPGSSSFEYLQLFWTPVFPGVATSYETIIFESDQFGEN